MNARKPAGIGRAACAATLAFLVVAGGCSALRPAATPSPAGFHSIDAMAWPPATPRRPTLAPTLTLLVGNPRASAGFDSQRMIYVQRAHTLEYFARNEWVDTPARMLAPLLVAAIAESGAFRAVARVPSTATGALRLDTEVLVLQQEFLAKPSRVRFALRAELVADASREVIASRVFEAEVAASAEAPYAGVVAANLAVRDVLERLAAFCAEAAAGWKAPP